MYNQFIGNIDPEYLSELYKKFKTDPQSVTEDWRLFFQGYDMGRKNSEVQQISDETFEKEFKVINLIDGYRKRGHLFTHTNPVRARRKYSPTLDIENYSLTPSDLNQTFHAGKEIGLGASPLSSIIGHLKETYCESVGCEFMFIRSAEKIQWLTNRFEKTRNKTVFTSEEKLQIYNHLIKAAGFENFIHKKFTGQKRFSLEGTEVLIPALHCLIDKGARLGIEEYVLGMAHRGRLNVLANFLNKPYENLFHEFNAEQYEDNIALGDVKYHLGFGNKIKTFNGYPVELHLSPNPSHLEAVTPVIQGISRGKIEQKYKGDNSKICPVIIHGDAAIAGQGVVYEVVQMAGLDGYKTGGTIHIVINNQVGFTTNYLDARTSTYCTDVGKVTKAPIFHINGDDVEALIHTIRLAIEYRQQYKSDVFIDILSYRKYGHNEGDEPRFTQPTLYKAIEKHPNPRDIYKEKLISEKVITAESANQLEKDFENLLENKFEASKIIRKTRIKQFLNEDWKKFKYSECCDFDIQVDSGVQKSILLEHAQKINQLPPEEKFFSKSQKLVKDRLELINKGYIDWAMGELMAYSTLLQEGIPVRISGQDSVRGTFAHRHAGFVIENSDKIHFPLKHIAKGQAAFSIYNSPLNEYGVLGFEYGYALATPYGLTVWEAQFGDFSNVAQVIIDQYIASAGEKWGLMNGLVLFLPHGFEGQGPEHSSARIERFLAMASGANMQIINPTTPANLFHALRTQVHRDFRVPLVVFTPKSLLRHPSCISTIEDLESGSFMPVLDDDDVDANSVKRVVFCSGKIYYELLVKKKEFNARDIALVRLEQLHPFPSEQVNKVIKRYPNCMLHIWIQEEPENMGAWYHVENKITGVHLIPVTRQASGSPATGLNKIHLLQQQEIISKIFKKCTCEQKNNYCGLQCSTGKSIKETLDQHLYFEKEKA